MIVQKREIRNREKKKEKRGGREGHENKWSRIVRYRCTKDIGKIGRLMKRGNKIEKVSTIIIFLISISINGHGHTVTR